MAKKQREDSTGGKNVMTNEEARKKLKSGIVTVTQYMEQIDLHKESIKETIADLAEQSGLDKKAVKKLATTLFKHNYSSLQEENRHFELLYEMVVEGRVRDDDAADTDSVPITAQDRLVA